jgi:dynein heavy chain 2
LVAGLESEFERWNKEVENMDTDLKKVPYFCLLGAAFITYLCNAPEDIRKKSLDRWMSMFGVKRFDLKHYLSSEREMLQWRSEGLPSDQLSIENALCVLQAQTSPYLIDPSGRASQWLKKHLEISEKPFEVTTQEDDRFILTLELAIRFGKTLVIEQVNNISPIIYPILRKDQAGQGK